MFNPMTDIVKENYSFDGMYRGIVIDNNDPLKSGRIRVRIYPMFEKVRDNDLPWAIVADPSMGGFANMGGANIPVVNAHVFCFFENGDFRFPVYFAGAPAIQNDTSDLPTEATGAKYPNNRVYKSKNGVVVEIDDSVGDTRYKITHPSGSSIELKNNGDVAIIVDNNQTITVTGTCTINATGTATVNSDADVVVSAGGNASITATGIVSISGSVVNIN